MVDARAHHYVHTESNVCMFVCVPFIQRSFHPLAYTVFSAQMILLPLQLILRLLLVQHTNIQIFISNYNHTRFTFIQRKQFLMNYTHSSILKCFDCFDVTQAPEKTHRNKFYDLRYPSQMIIYSAIPFNQNFTRFHLYKCGLRIDTFV